MKTFESNALANRIIEGLKTKGHQLTSTDLALVAELIESPYKSNEVFQLENCSWGKEFPVLSTSKYVEVSSSHNYTNGRNADSPRTVEEAIKEASIMRDKNDEYNDYWNNQDEIITEVITIRKVVAIVESKDKKS